jgi:hypothetical protein
MRPELGILTATREEARDGNLENYGILGWIVIGLLAGGDRQAVDAGKDPGGCLITMLLGNRRRAAGRISRQDAVGWYDESEGRGIHRRRSSAHSSSCLITDWCCAVAEQGTRCSYPGHRRFVRLRGMALLVGGNPCARP